MDRKLPCRPYLSWAQIHATAAELDRRLGLSGRAMPIDIEEIAECDFAAELVPVADLHGLYGQPAAMAVNDGLIIYVDQRQYEQNTSFYRFAVAHELAHYILHLEYIRELQALYDDVQTWRDVVSAIPDDDYNWIEGQASELASLLLAPQPFFEDWLPTLLVRLEAALGDREAPDEEMVLEYLATPVGQEFGMTPAAAQARIRKSTVWREFQARHWGTQRADN